MIMDTECQNVDDIGIWFLQYVTTRWHVEKIDVTHCNTIIYHWPLVPL